jgi:ATP/maltotriose-dependent transcriptional regulator MalT
MRLILVGSAADRARLRSRFDGFPMEIVGEYATVAEARAANLDAEALVITNLERDDREFVEPLTLREIQVLELLAEGLSNKAIASRLGISDQTVKFHVASIAGKLGAANRTDTVRRAVRRGLITL